MSENQSESLQYDVTQARKALNAMTEKGVLRVAEQWDDIEVEDQSIDETRFQLSCKALVFDVIESVTEQRVSELVDNE